MTNFPLMAQGESEIHDKIWKSLLKAEIKLNQGMPKQLTKHLWIRQVVVDPTEKVVRYEGLVTDQSADFSEAKVQSHRMRYRQQSLNHLCGNPQSKKFLKILNLAGGKVEYVFYQKKDDHSASFLLSFFVEFQDCQSSVLS